MGLLDSVLGKKEDAAGNEAAKENENARAAAGKAEAKEGPEKDEGAEGKYNEPCSLCNKAGTDKKWAGKHWHKKCIRKMKHAAKGML